MAIFNFDDSNKTLNCAFSGKLDTNISLEIGPEINKNVSDYKNTPGHDDLKVVFDFENVEFVTSSFIRITVNVAKHVGKKNFSIVNTNPMIKKTFKIAGLDTELNVT